MIKYRICLKNTTHTRLESGNIEATRKGNVNVFAKFYKDLFSKKNDEREDTQDSEARPEKTLVTMLTITLKTMSKTHTSQNSP